MQAHALEQIPMKYRVPEIAFPKGWYAVAEANEVGPDTLMPVSYLDQQMVVYRTKDGKAQVADAYCPHLGAHLASHDGCVTDGEIVCPFHKWRFDGATGRVVGIPYSKVLPPSSVGLTLYPTREVNGIVMMWYHPKGAAPDFEPYESAVFKQEKWVLYDVKTWITTCPFRDILENLFDTAHIMTLHRGAEPAKVDFLEFEPYGLRLAYGSGVEHIYTGVTQVTQHFKRPESETLFFHSFTPIDDERFMHRGRLYIKDMGSKELNERVGKGWISHFVSEVEQDQKVLNFKKHITQPKLCAGDGPIMKFREYANQYYV